MAARQKTVPIEFNIYIPTGTNNPYIRNAVNYSLHTATFNNSVVSSITDTPNGDTTYTSLPGDSTMVYKQMSASLLYGTEHQVFQFTFTANSATANHFDSGGQSLIKKRIINRFPKNAKTHFDLLKNNDGNTNDDYANRWRFVEEVTARDSNQKATTVVLKGFYTTPDYRADDALQQDGTAITTALERAKNRGIILYPMLKASTVAQTASINFVDIKDLVKQFDGEEEISFFPREGKPLQIDIEGTPAASGTLRTVQNDGLDFVRVDSDFTLDDNGRATVVQTLPQTSSDDEFETFVVPSSGVATGTNVPIDASRRSFKLLSDVGVTIAATQTASLYTLPGATTLLATRAYRRVGNNNSRVIGTTTEFHKTIPRNEQLGERLFPFSIEIASADASKVELAADIGTTSGFISNLPVTNTDAANTGGGVMSVKHVFAREHDNKVTLHGYVAIRSVGGSNATIQIPIDNLIST